MSGPYLEALMGMIRDLPFEATHLRRISDSLEKLSETEAKTRLDDLREFKKEMEAGAEAAHQIFTASQIEHTKFETDRLARWAAGTVFASHGDTLPIGGAPMDRPTITDDPVTVEQFNTVMASVGYLFDREVKGFYIWKSQIKPKDARERSWPDQLMRRKPYWRTASSQTLVYSRNDVADALMEITGDGPVEVVRTIAAILKGSSKSKNKS